MRLYAGWRLDRKGKTLISPLLICWLFRAMTQSPGPVNGNSAGIILPVRDNHGIRFYHFYRGAMLPIHTIASLKEEMALIKLLRFPGFIRRKGSTIRYLFDVTLLFCFVSSKLLNFDFPAMPSIYWSNYIP